MTASIPARVLLAPIRFYQRYISPWRPPSCRYSPSCSSYAVEAIGQHGAVRGSWFAVRRLGRCHPWHNGGYDPVPPVRERSRRAGSSVSVTISSRRRATTEDETGSGHHSPAQTQAALMAAFTPDARPATAEAPKPRSNAA